MTLPDFTKIYNCIRHEVIGSGEKQEVCNLEDEGSAKLSVD